MHRKFSLKTLVYIASAIIILFLIFAIVFASIYVHNNIKKSDTNLLEGIIETSDQANADTTSTPSSTLESQTLSSQATSVSSPTTTKKDDLSDSQSTSDTLESTIETTKRPVNTTPPSNNTVLNASTFISNMNVGWNLGDSFDSKATTAGKDINLNQEILWGNPAVTKELIDYVAACGFNTIRIPVTWYYNCSTDVNGNVHPGPKFLARIKEVCDYAIANNMYVIINSHHDTKIFYAGVSDSEMNKVYNNAKTLWTDIADYFKDYDDHLIFEGFNEIDNLARSWNYSDAASAQMNKLNQIFVDAVRSTGNVNSNRVLIVPTLLNGMTSKFLDSFKLPTDSCSNGLVVEVHTYQKKFNQDLENELTLLADFSNRINAPVIIGEFGTTTSYPILSLRTTHASNFIARAAAHGIKCIWWDNGYEYSIIDRYNFGNSKTDIIQALMNGAKGTKYRIPGEIKLTTINSFTYKMLNKDTGTVDTAYWGTLTTDVFGNGIAISNKKYCTLSLKATGDATGIWLQRVVFYDSNGKPLTFTDSDGSYACGKELQNTYYICNIPANAAYIRVSLNSPTLNVSKENYSNYFNSGDLELDICAFNLSDIQAN